MNKIYHKKLSALITIYSCLILAAILNPNYLAWVFITLAIFWVLYYGYLMFKYLD